MSTGSSRRWAALGAVAAVALTVSACTGSDPEEEQPTGSSAAPAAAPAAVPLSADEVPPGLKVGVIVSLASQGDSGVQWSRAAQGAEVAAYRFGEGGAPVDVVPVDDRGTQQGASAAVDELVREQVAGIVLASSGPHVNGSIKAAAEAGIPVLMPYAPDPDLPDGAPAWLTGPAQGAIKSTIAGALGRTGVSKPVLVDAGGGEIAGLSLADRLALPVSAQPPVAERLANDIARQVDRGSADSVIVTGAAARQAVMVRALQGAGVSVPFILTPDALSPALATDLAESQGSLSSELVTVGDDAGDLGALEPGAAGDALSAYFAALRAAAEDASVEAFFDGQPFSTVAPYADIRSHDAVVVIARAAAAAGSTDPAEVADALGRLQLGRTDGLVGASLDLTSQQAMPAGEVVALQATSQDPGVRPVPTDEQGPGLSWFPVPQG